MYSIGADQEQIKADIMTNGPVEAAFTVYADFPSYKSGLYMLYMLYLYSFDQQIK